MKCKQKKFKTKFMQTYRLNTFASLMAVQAQNNFIFAHLFVSGYQSHFFNPKAEKSPMYYTHIYLGTRFQNSKKVMFFLLLGKAYSQNILKQKSSNGASRQKKYF